MNKSNYFVFILVMTAIMLLVLGNWVTPVQANNTGIGIGTPVPTSTPVTVTDIPGEIPSAEEQEELKAVIQAYVEIRYHALSVLDSEDFKRNGFGSLISDTSEAGVFLSEEMSKLNVEIKRADLNRLRYVDYKYFLDFRSITFDPVAQTASMSMIEGNEVVTKISAELNPGNPTVSHSAGIEHTITLQKIQGQWKIISDTYNDDLWKMLRHAGKSTDEILRTAEKMIQILEASPWSSTLGAGNAETMPAYVVPDDPSSHPYVRAGAVAYALQHWSYDAGLYNLDYPQYERDCQNFVSQAIYEGGKASMFIPDPLPDRSEGGQSGWYLLNEMQRAADWNDVGGFYTFVTDQSEAITEGPEGTLLSERSGNQPDQVPAGLMLGDVIQFEWAWSQEHPDNDQVYDHSAIVVGFEADGAPTVATHTIDHYGIRYTELKPWEKIRFIHIERSDGYYPVNVEIEATDNEVQSSDDAGPEVEDSGCSGAYPYWNEIYFGKCPDGNPIYSGLRFNNILIPQGAQIKYAYLTFTVDGDYTNDVSVRFYGEASANAVTFTETDPIDRPRLSEFVWWNLSNDSPWYLGDHWTTPQLASVLEAIVNQPEIVNQPHWRYGNSLALLLEGRNANYQHRRFLAFERSDDLPKYIPAKLKVAYDGEGLTPPNATIADFDGNGSTDISVFRPANGVWYVKDQFSQQWGGAGDVPVPAEYNGDGVTDVAVWRPANGTWYFKDQFAQQWGGAGDVPVPADYNGDGVTDMAVWRPANGTWYFKDQFAQQWGGAGDVPVPADYDGDGVMDVAVWRPANGTWYVKDQFAQQWGGAGDIPIPADYNGDGTIDLAVYRPANAVWYVEDQFAVQYGGAGDIPVPGDYNGDGATDVAVFRPSNGVWYVKDQFSVQYGGAGDFPVPARDTNGDGDPYQ